MDTKKVFIANIQHLMAVKGIDSQNQLAKLAKIDQKTVNNWFNPDKKSASITLATIDKVAKVLGVCSWHLLVPDLPVSQFQEGKCKTVSPTGFVLLNAYEAASKASKQSILSDADIILDRSGEFRLRDKVREALRTQDAAHQH